MNRGPIISSASQQHLLRCVGRHAGAGDIHRNASELDEKPGIRCFTLHTYDDDPNIIRRLVGETVDLFVSSRIRPAIFERIPLSEARRAHELLDARKILGKVILKP
jgi:NADPH:quinone reductase-like Zn-dependent oxidoreductase